MNGFVPFVFLVAEALSTAGDTALSLIKPGLSYSNHAFFLNLDHPVLSTAGDKNSTDR
jgi:hypothetical protein